MESVASGKSGEHTSIAQVLATGALALCLALCPTVIGCAARGAAPAAATTPAAASPSLYAEPWLWRDETGAPVRLARWRGGFVVVTVVYTTCTGTCPLTLEKLQRIDRRLQREGKSASFVLVTLDPANDTATELSRWKRERNLPAAWTLLRGDPTATRQLADRLQIRILDMADGDHIFHDSRIVLLDPDGRILGEVQS
jgi:cytochrome oxidase Cu insertion factor (SCO1/SenC/PrrC family)